MTLLPSAVVFSSPNHGPFKVNCQSVPSWTTPSHSGKHSGAYWWAQTHLLLPPSPGKWGQVLTAPRSFKPPWAQTSFLRDSHQDLMVSISSPPNCRIIFSGGKKKCHSTFSMLSSKSIVLGITFGFLRRLSFNTQRPFTSNYSFCHRFWKCILKLRS